MIGLSHGVKPPFVSLGIEKTEKNLKEKISYDGLKEKLIAKGLIVENGEYASTGGRKAKSIGIKPLLSVYECI